MDRKKHGVTFKGYPLGENDLRLIGLKKGCLRLFDGRLGKIAYPYAEFKNRITLFDGSKRDNYQYVRLEEIVQEIKTVKIGKMIVAERRKFGDRLLSTGKGYYPCRFKQYTGKTN